MGKAKNEKVNLVQNPAAATLPMNKLCVQPFLLELTINSNSAIAIDSKQLLQGLVWNMRVGQADARNSMDCRFRDVSFQQTMSSIKERHAIHNLGASHMNKAEGWDMNFIGSQLIHRGGRILLAASSFHSHVRTVPNNNSWPP
jgi:hypothetical protein